MKNEFIPYEQALALKELGFDEPCFDYYIPNKNYDPISKIFNSYDLGKHNSNTNTIYKNGIISRPLYQQALRWFREKYDYDVSIKKCTSSEYKFEIEQLFVEGDNYYFTDFVFKTYEKAELECLKKLIEIVKSKKS